MTSRIDDLRTTEVEEVREYEKRHKNRYTLLERLDYSLVKSTPRRSVFGRLTFG